MGKKTQITRNDVMELLLLDARPWELAAVREKTHAGNLVCCIIVTQADLICNAKEHISSEKLEEWRRELPHLEEWTEKHREKL